MRPQHHLYTRQNTIIPVRPARIGSLLLHGSLAILIFTVIQARAQESHDYQKSLKDVSQQIKKISETLNANRKLLKTERDRLAILEGKIVELRSQQKISREQIRAHKSKKIAVQTEMANLLEQQSDDIESLKLLLRTRHKQGNPNYLRLLLNQKNPYAVGRLSHYYRYFADAQQQKLQNLNQKMADVRRLQQRAFDTGERLAAEQSRLQKQSRELQILQTERSRRVARLDEQVSKSSDELERLQADRERLNKLLQQIAKQAERLKQLEAQRLAREQEKPETDNRVRRAPVAGGFRKQRGQLNAPVLATLERKFGQRLPGSGMRAQGHFYKTQEEQPIQAIFRGNVLFADYLKGYGLLIIVDHGDDHISLYGHNEVLYKQVGDAVNTGEVIAKTGKSGGLRQPGLYFEIRHNAAPVDPAQWLGQ